MKSEFWRIMAMAQYSVDLSIFQLVVNCYYVVRYLANISYIFLERPILVHGVG